jgi:hypothetical protein
MVRLLYCHLYHHGAKKLTSSHFYKTCQAISEVLPPGNDEKRLLEGFLAESKRVKLDTEPKQRGLFE